MTDPIALAERLLAVVDRGRVTATYKYAVLIALVDLAFEHTSSTGAAPTSLTTTQLAEKVVELYWPHAAPIHVAGEARLLAQNLPQRDKSSIPEIVRDIAAFRATAAPDPSSALARARLAAPDAWRRLVRAVEWKLVEMPLPKLQRVGVDDTPFLFTIGWSDAVRKRDFDATTFDNHLRFLDGAAEALVRLATLLRPLVLREWTAVVARFNRLPDSELEDKLFGVDRAALAAVRAPLVELQHGACFYCARALSKGAAGQVDHFVPWARHANDAIENLVVAHAGCNGDKSDHLGDVGHVDRWLRRNVDQVTALAQIAAASAWERAPDRSLGVARGIYLRLPAGAPLWRTKREFAPNVPGAMHAAFA